MAEQIPITTPPSRRDAHLAYSNNIDVDKSASNFSRTLRLEPHHHSIIESGSQSAKSSPLPHRRLDKLEGVIRDKATAPAPCMTRITDTLTDAIASCDTSPVSLRKHVSSGSATIERRFLSNHQESPMPFRKSMTTTVNESKVYYGHRSATDYINAAISHNSNAKNIYQSENIEITPMMRRRVESDCSRSRKPNYTAKEAESSAKWDCVCTPQLNRKFASPIRNVLGEPGCFSSPIHQQRSNEQISKCSAFRKPTSIEDDLNVPDMPLQPDQNIVSGWLKFRDNKRVSK